MLVDDNITQKIYPFKVLIGVWSNSFDNVTGMRTEELWSTFAKIQSYFDCDVFND